jgi:hypothetical protein
MTDKVNKPLAVAVTNREQADSLVWLVVEATNAVLARDSDGAFVQTAMGEFEFEPNENDWIVMLPDDLPAWVMEPDVIGSMKAGMRVNKNPESEKARWYRGITVTAASAGEIH